MPTVLFMTCSGHIFLSKYRSDRLAEFRLCMTLCDCLIHMDRIVHTVLFMPGGGVDVIIYEITDLYNFSIH